MPIRQPELTRSALITWRACDLKPGERSLVLGDTGSSETVLDAFFATAVALGAAAAKLVVPARRRSYAELPDHVVAMMLEHDIVMNLLSAPFGYSAGAERVAADPRVRVATQPGDEGAIPTIIACPPDERIARRARRVAELLEAARRITVRSALGTDLTVPLAPPEAARRRAIGGGGRAPGSSDAPFMGSVTVPFPEGGLTGTLVMRGGMRFQGPIAERHWVEEPTRIEVRAGRIERVETTPFGRRLQRWLDQAGYPEARRSMDCNFGVDDRARLENLDNTAVHSACGCIMLGFSLPVVRRGAAVERPGYHLDMTLVGADIWLDDRPLIEGGRYTAGSGVLEA